MFNNGVLESTLKILSILFMFEARSISCRRNARLIFRELNFCLAPGALLHITGANGSGKSSLLRILAGLCPLADGALLWDGQPISDDTNAYRQRLHYLGHLDALKPELTGDEMLDYWQALRPGAVQNPEDVFGINAFRQKPIRYLSAGQKRRLALSRLTLHEAPLWLLDEPTTSLDHAGQDLLLTCIAAHRATGGIVIVAAHHAVDAPDIQNLGINSAKKAMESPSRKREGLGVGGELAPLRNISNSASSLEIPTTSPPPAPPASGRGVLASHHAHHSIFKLCRHELRMHARHKTEWAALLLFFGIVILLLPFALGPEPDLLQHLAPGLIWLAALLMSLLALDKLFIQDARDGTLDLMLLSPLPLPVIVAAKLLAQSAAMLIALGLMLVPVALLLGMNFAVLPLLALTLLLGVPSLVLLGGIAGSIIVVLHHNPALLTLLLVPFYIPILIFAVSACDAAAMGSAYGPPLALLGAILAVLLPTAPFTIATALRQGQG